MATMIQRAPAPARLTLDAIDHAILSILADNGRITNARLALDVALSESACFNRVRRLEQGKVIESYRAVISQRAFGPHIVVLVDVVLESHKRQEYVRFEQIVRTLPEVIECISISGQFDYRMKVVATDMDDYIRVMEDIADRHGRLSQYFSNIMMKKVKQLDAFLPALQGGSA